MGFSSWKPGSNNLPEAMALSSETDGIQFSQAMLQSGMTHHLSKGSEMLVGLHVTSLEDFAKVLAATVGVTTGC